VILLWLDDRLPWVALVLIIARDAFLIVGAKVLMPRGYEFSVSWLGKLATWVLYAAVAAIIATTPGTDWPLWLFWIGVGLALLAAALYGLGAWRTVRR
jgi:phosphatidylglycerophosphate synthase